MATKTSHTLPTLEEMAGAGMHYGHRTRRWHPKMDKYIYSSREGIHIINLEKTLSELKNATSFLKEKSKSDIKILLVGTKRQASEVIRKVAKKSGLYYVIERWPGGLLTNFDSILNTIKRLEVLSLQASDEKHLETLTTKNKYQLLKEVARLEKLVGGLHGMTKTPDVLIIIDPRREKTAVNEAKLTKTPTIGIIDTNTDPSLVNYPIPANDDAIKSIEIILDTLVSSISKKKATTAKTA